MFILIVVMKKTGDALKNEDPSSNFNINNLNDINNKKRLKKIVLTVIAGLFVLFIIVPLILSVFFNNTKFGNVALIHIDGPIMDGSSFLGEKTISSQKIVEYVKEANDNKEVKVILVEINSPGGTPVASDEIGIAVQKSTKPVVALIREQGTSGAYWVASSADYVIANRMSYTGSIGVIGSYLEFSGLMEKYGVGYEQLISGKDKDLGVPYRKLTDDQRKLLQAKLDKVHDYFIEVVAKNRNLSESKVRELATGEFYLGSEALDLGLVDELGGRDEAEAYITKNYGIEEIEYADYKSEGGILDLLTGVFSDFSFQVGRGFGSIFTEGQQKVMLI